MKAPPLVIVGLDTADPSLLLRWAADGTMPTVGETLRRGVRAGISGPEMSSSHAVWLSLLSGRTLREHGYYHRRQLVPGTYEIRGFVPPESTAQPFWTAIRGQDRSVVVVDAPGMALVDGLPGAQVMDWGTDVAARSPRSHPSSLIEDINRRFRQPQMVDETQGSRRRDLRMYHRLERRIADKGALLRQLISSERPDLTVAVFADTHSGSHRFWKYRPAAGDSSDAGGMGNVLRDVYRAVDREIGLLLGALPQHTNLILVSNGGITDGQPVWDFMEGFFHQLGYHQREAAPNGLKATFAGFVDDVRRRIQARYLSSTGGNALPTSLDGTDWRRTTAFALPAYYTGLVRVNLKGREPQGIVEPGPAYEALLARIEADLRRLVHGDTGAPVIASVTRTALMNGGTPSDVLPDLFVHWNLESRTQRVIHPQAVLECSRFGIPRTNHHGRTGLLIAAGPSIDAGGEVEDIAPTDLAPLCLSLLSGERSTWRAHASA